MKEPNLRTAIADIHTLDLSTLPIKDTLAFILLQKTFKDNLTLVKRIKKSFPDKFILTKATSENEASELSENGADRVVQTTRIITNTILSELEVAKLKRAASHLVTVIKAATRKGLAIFYRTTLTLIPSLPDLH